MFAVMFTHAMFLGFFHFPVSYVCVKTIVVKCYTETGSVAKLCLEFRLKIAHVKLPQGENPGCVHIE